MKSGALIGGVRRGVGKERRGWWLRLISDDFLNDKNNRVVLFVLVIDGTFKKMVVTLAVHVDEVRVGTGNGGNLIF